MKTIYIACAALFCLSINAQTMFVRPITGSQTTYSVADIQKLTFDNGNLIVSNETGQNDTFALADNRYITFSDLTLGTSNPVSLESKYYVYPNPSNQWLNIGNENPTQTLRLVEILSIEGKLLTQQKPSTADTQIDISALPQGMYLCKITNGNQQQTLKFSKQ